MFIRALPKLLHTAAEENRGHWGRVESRRFGESTSGAGGAAMFGEEDGDGGIAVHVGLFGSVFAVFDACIHQ
jgi:hypothetical protein